MRIWILRKEQGNWWDREFYGMQSVNIPAVLTAILVGSLPVILLYFFAQEKVVNGLTQGAVKG